MIFSLTKVNAQDTISKATTKFNIGIRTEPSIANSFFDTIPEDVDVYITDFKNDLWKVNYFDITGWLPTSSLYRTRAMNEVIRDAKRIALIEKYGEEAGKKISKQNVWLGMTKDMLVDSKGYPDKRNISKGSYGTHEQWVYKNRYIYLEDGVVTSFQSR